MDAVWVWQALTSKAPQMNTLMILSGASSLVSFPSTIVTEAIHPKCTRRVDNYIGLAIILYL